MKIQNLVICIALIVTISLFAFAYIPHLQKINQDKFSCDKLSLGPVYLKPSEKSLASNIVNVEGIVSIPEETLILSKTDSLDCNQYNLNEYTLGWVKN